MVDEALEWFGRGEVAEIVQHHVPEPGVEEMEHGVLRAADVKINPTGIVLSVAEPVARGFLSYELTGVARVAITQVVPAGAGPLGHGVQLAGGGRGVAHPIDGLGQGRFRGAGRFEVS